MADGAVMKRSRHSGRMEAASPLSKFKPDVAWCPAGSMRGGIKPLGCIDASMAVTGSWKGLDFISAVDRTNRVIQRGKREAMRMAGNKDAGSPSSGCLVVVHTASYRSMQCLCESSQAYFLSQVERPLLTQAPPGPSVSPRKPFPPKMASTPPASPIHQRPSSTVFKPSRSSSRLSMSSKTGFGSRASDEDARTAVRVAVRIRPPLQPSDPGYDLIPQRFQRSMVQTSSDTNLSIESPQGRKLFVFDRVFAPDVEQQGIWDYLADSVNSFAQGYNVSLLAYGQSGAGKSYTMGTSGPLDQQDDKMMGVIPRAATALFAKLDSLYGKNDASIGSIRGSQFLTQIKNPRDYAQQNPLGDRHWSLKATYVEIYNEQLRDLLTPDTTPLGERTNVAIREDTKGNILVTGLHQVQIESAEDLMNALALGSTIRQTDATAINAKSSRSHAVFSLNLVQRRSKTQTSAAEKRFSVPIEAMTGQEVSITTDSKLHFVDLAGSERLKNTGAQGDRAKEGISINAGLASLGKVISQLSSRQSGSHVSYRDSKLTRLLQDSLGGNAITYMIACVTPAEFHLSETLNTVQYAQRARAIQSKPRIQQVEEGDRQAVIDRLKAEVTFLREQIRNSQNGDSGSKSSGAGLTERSERDKEREAEMQNQILDMQENYNALGQRHARLIAEMARAGDKESALRDASDSSQFNSATDRLNRSNTFAQAVEQVVLEYEKTIESLEQSLSSTRSTLSATETSLLERETKLAYIDTINTQLQSRVQKLMDREANTESYLHDLESKLDGHSTGDERNASVIIDLRKEISRARENEASCEDYISTLEERLAEADQDGELMQREIDRLEQIIERQRSLGKLDSLLYELDHVEEMKQPEINGTHEHSRRGSADHSRKLSHIRTQSQINETIHEDDEDSDADTANSHASTVREDIDEDSLDHVSRAFKTTKASDGDALAKVTQSPAQTKYVSDKLEDVTQELVGLRVEHETTVNDYDALQAKYEAAMHKIASLQDVVDESRHVHSTARDSIISEVSSSQRPDSFRSSVESQLVKEGARSSASRSLSSELSSAMESADTANTSAHEDMVEDDDTSTTKPDASSDDVTHSELTAELTQELERLKQLADDREEAAKELASKYAQLQSTHSDTLDAVEELKTNLFKARAVEATSPRTSSPVIRRKSSQNLLIIDRAHRSFASLRNIASENFETRPEVMQNFELNLNAAMHELHTRSERIQELEASVASTKKEMETKMTIISGLTRERTSLKASPMDMSMVAALRQKLEQNEKQLAGMGEIHKQREQSLLAELEQLRVQYQQSDAKSRGGADTSALDKDKHISSLQSELSAWETKHNTALAAMQAAETDLHNTVRGLETELATATTNLQKVKAASSADFDTIASNERKHQDLVDFLRSEIDEYKKLIYAHSAKVTELERAHVATTSQLEEMSTSHASKVKEHEELVAQLQAQIVSFEDTSKSHKEALDELSATHAKALTEVKTQEQKGYEAQMAVLLAEHHESNRKLEAEVNDARDDLMKVATQVAAALGLEVSIEKLTERIDGLVNDRKLLETEQSKSGEMQKHVAELTTVNETIMRDLEEVKGKLAELLAGPAVETEAAAEPVSVKDVKEQIIAVKSKMDDLESKNKKHSRLVEELEEQLQNNFDEAQMTNKRLSSMQTERAAQLDEVNAARTKLQTELDTLRIEYNSLQAKLGEGDANGEVRRSNSGSTIRKAASHNSLPSPPPAIPLPPLPGSATSSVNGAPASPPSRPLSKDNMNISQITEDQEARIRTIEKHLYAERQLTQTLEEALSDLEKQSKKVKTDCDAWRKRASDLELEVKDLKERPTEPAQDNRWSMQVVEEERKKRQAAELARKQLEERMNAIKRGKKKKGSLNCF
ncbi:kinesin family [Cordyceps militaris]|uniref:Kinesin family n=1 Tax=Cordyceps militaris TaxID=73501 RepID=A0A2H4SAE4_CORMI|nr:kinesin family [Cordyceps militaris]